MFKKRTKLIEKEIVSFEFTKDDCKTEDDLKDRADFLLIMRKKHIHRTHKEKAEDSRGASVPRVADVVPADHHNVSNASNLVLGPSENAESPDFEAELAEKLNSSDDGADGNEGSFGFSNCDSYSEIERKYSFI